MQRRKTAAANIAAARIGHRQRITHGYRRIDGIAPLPHDFNADIRSHMLRRHHHAVFGGRRRPRIGPCREVGRGDAKRN